ncbi:MAG: hypothetical protein HFH11_11775 [Dorea sp.]|jgi:hypothetical protein|nr:hypothetical protein [Dorea sp.]
MKKKLMAILLGLTISVFTVACSNDSLDRGEKETFDELPGEMKLNGSTLSLEDISIYQSENNYEWYVYATLSVDISNLSEEEKHWLDKDNDEVHGVDRILNPKIYLTCEDNNIDFDDMMDYGYSDVGNYRVYFFGKLDTYKNNFDHSEATVSIGIKQDETYKTKNKDGDELELNKNNEYKYHITGNVKYVQEMPKDISDAFNKKLSNAIGY